MYRKDFNEAGNRKISCGRTESISVQDLLPLLASLLEDENIISQILQKYLYLCFLPACRYTE